LLIAAAISDLMELSDSSAAECETARQLPSILVHPMAIASSIGIGACSAHRSNAALHHCVEPQESPQSSRDKPQPRLDARWLRQL